MDFYWQWVKPQLPRVRYSTLAPPSLVSARWRRSSWPSSRQSAPPTGEKYFKDECPEFVNSKDVKLDRDDAEQRQRLACALAVLLYFHHDCARAVAGLDRGARIQFLCWTDVRLARASYSGLPGAAR